MTIAQLFETILGKACCMTGHLGNGTAFDEVNVRSIEKTLMEYNFDKNIIQLMIENPIVKMERKQGTLGKFDLSSLYQEGLRFQGPKPKTKSIKLKTSKGRVKINMNIKKSIIYFEQGVVRVAIDMNYQ